MAETPAPFRVDESDALMVHHEPLLDQAAVILEGAGMPPDDAALVARALTTADLRGVDSHGVSNMLREYVEQLLSGHINPRAQPKVVASAPSAGSIDSDGGHGIVVGRQAMRLALEKARATSVGMISIRNGRHIGMASFTAMQALEHGMIGICTSATGPRMIPTLGAEPKLGTNPLSVAVPALHQPPFVYDAAWTTVAGNKIRLAERLGNKLPGGLVADPSGRPVLEPVDVDPAHMTSLLPVGSTPLTGSHKGYAMGCITEILSSMLSGSTFMSRIGRGFSNHFVAAIDPTGFVDHHQFLAEMDEFLLDLTRTKPAEGCERVLYPGQLEAEIEKVRSEHGVPLHPEVIDSIRDLCSTVGVEFTLEA